MEDILKHHGVKGMKWGVRKDRETSGTRKSATEAAIGRAKTKVVEGAYATVAKINPRELNYTIKRAMARENASDSEAVKIVDDIVSKTGVLPTDENIMQAIDRDGVQQHKKTTYDNLDDVDIKGLKKYTDSAAYSRAINTYLATGQPAHVSEKAQALKDTIAKNTLSDITVYRSTNLKFSTTGLGNKLDKLGEEGMASAFNSFDANFRGKSFKENRVYSTSTSPSFAIDTWRKVNPTAAKTYNSYLVISTKNTPGLLADGRTSNGGKLVNTRSNQEAILAPGKMTYKKLAWDEQRNMFAVHLEAE